MLKDRIQSIMQVHSLTASRLAEAIGVQPSSISHILSGRNKPGYDFLLSILNRFPEIDPDWLITGRGNMYRKTVDESTKASGREISTVQATPRSSSGSGAAESNPATRPEFFSFVAEAEPASNMQVGMDSTVASEPAVIASGVQATSGNREIEKIIILYTDGTFGIYANR